ncbi:hypothetical protein CVR97_28370, partial [Salmonella enterica subsp. enterica serovar Typhimurium]|uniref:hypothetical protein n=1 Tax=Salmonella enterica TaxID=28901 RepID=UPI000CC53A08
MTNTQEQSALASELFGTKLSRDLMPALQDGALSLDDARQKAEELGIVIDGDAIDAASKFGDTWDNIKSSITAFGQSLIAQLMPAFQTVMDWVIEKMPAIQSTIGGVLSWLSEKGQ